MIDSIKKEYSENFEANEPAENENWIRFKFTLINLIVTSSIIAAYNMQTFYTTVVMVASSTLKPICMFFSYTGTLYEVTHGQPIFKLIECCYMARHEKDLALEEESYRMLQEIMSQP